jgi:hypothetical protein
MCNVLDKFKGRGPCSTRRGIEGWEEGILSIIRTVGSAGVSRDRMSPRIKAEYENLSISSERIHTDNETGVHGGEDGACLASMTRFRGTRMSWDLESVSINAHII